MYIHRALMLLLLMLYVFTPAIQEWVLSGGVEWYRPFLIWVVTIGVAYWWQRNQRDVF